MYVPNSDTKNHSVSSDDDDHRIPNPRELVSREIPFFSKENICELENSCYMKKKIISAIKKSLKTNNNQIQHTLSLNDVSVSEEKEIGNGCRQSLNIRIDLNDRLLYSSQNAGAMNIETFKLNDTTPGSCSKCSHCSDKEQVEDNVPKPSFVCVKCGKTEVKRWFHENCKEKCCISTSIYCDKCLKYKLLSNDHNFDVLKHARFSNYMYVVTCPNGGGLSLHMDYEKIINLTFDQQRCIAEDFLKEAFREDDKEFAQFTIAIVHNGASFMPDLLKLLTELHPSLPVKTTKLKCNTETEQMDLGTYYTKVKETYNNGTYAFGPLNETQAASVKNGESGAYLPELLSLLEKSPFLSLVLPWSDMTTKRFKTPHESDDGPIFWCRPGEQIVSLDRNSKRNRWNADEIETFLKERQQNLKCSSEKQYIVEELKKYRRSYSNREFLFEDRTRPHADQVWGNHFEPTAAVGVIQAIHPDEEPKHNRACKDIVVFHAKHFEILEALLHIDVTAAPKQQCAEWLDDAKLNMIRQMSIRFSKLHLHDNDIYFIPRKIVHQFKTISATLSVAWHTRLIEYSREPDPVHKAENLNEDVKTQRSRSTTPVTPKKPVKKKRKLAASDSDSSDFEITPKKKKKVISRSPSPFFSSKKKGKPRSRSCTPKKTPRKYVSKTPKKKIKVEMPEMEIKSEEPIAVSPIPEPSESREKTSRKNSKTETDDLAGKVVSLSEKKSEDQSKERSEKSDDKPKLSEKDRTRDRDRSKSKKKKKSKSRSRSPKKHDKKRFHESKDKEKRSHSSHSKSERDKSRSHSHHSSKSSKDRHRHHDKDRKSYNSKSPKSPKRDDQRKSKSKEELAKIDEVKVEPEIETSSLKPVSPDVRESSIPANESDSVPVTGSQASIGNSNSEMMVETPVEATEATEVLVKSEPRSPKDNRNASGLDVDEEIASESQPNDNDTIEMKMNDETHAEVEINNELPDETNSNDVTAVEPKLDDESSVEDKLNDEPTLVESKNEIPSETKSDNEIFDETKSKDEITAEANSDQEIAAVQVKSADEVETEVHSEDKTIVEVTSNDDVATETKDRTTVATKAEVKSNRQTVEPRPEDLADKPKKKSTKLDQPAKERAPSEPSPQNRVEPETPAKLPTKTPEPVRTLKKPAAPAEVKKSGRKDEKLWNTPLFSFEDCDKYVLTKRPNSTKNGDKLVKQKPLTSLPKSERSKKRSRSRSFSPPRKEETAKETQLDHREPKETKKLENSSVSEKEKSSVDKKSLEHRDRKSHKHSKDSGKEVRKRSRSPEKHNKYSKKHKHRSRSKTRSEDKSKVTSPPSSETCKVLDGNYSNLNLMFPCVKIEDIGAKLKTNSNNNVIKYDSVDESTLKEGTTSEEQNQK